MWLEAEPKLAGPVDDLRPTSDVQGDWVSYHLLSGFFTVTPGNCKKVLHRDIHSIVWVQTGISKISSPVAMVSAVHEPGHTLLRNKLDIEEFESYGMIPAFLCISKLN